MTSFDSETLFVRHAASLRSLAAVLVQDPAAADDAVQETMLVALQRPPRHTESVGGWLATVMRNVVRRRVRGERRRQQREAEVAVDESVVDEAQALERQEVLHQVVAAAGSLSEPYRTVIWQRFFEGLSPSEIAARSGVPLATVKSRLQRGLEHVRRRLEEPRKDWRGALLVAFGWKDPVDAVGSAVPGGVRRSVAGVVAIAAAALILTSVYIGWPEPGATPVSAGSPQVAGAAPAAVTEPVAAPDQVRSVTGGAAAGEALPTALLRGRVVALDGGGVIAGAKVRVEPLAPARHQPPAEAETVTDVAGRFELRVVTNRALSLTVKAKGFRWIGADVARLQPDQVLDHGDVLLQRGAELRGKIVDADGAPLSIRAGDSYLLVPVVPRGEAPDWNEPPWVFAWLQPDGSFVGEDVLPPGRHRIELSNSYQQLISPPELVVDASVQLPELELQVRSRPSIRGRVVDALGQPVGPMQVKCGQYLFPVREDGTFWVTRMPDLGDQAELRFQTHEAEIALLTGLSWGTMDLQVLARRPDPLALQVVDVDGAPVENYAVALASPGGPVQPWFATRGLHPGGSCEVAGVQRTRTLMRVLPLERWLQPSEPQSVADSALEVRLQRRHRLDLELRCNGAPVDGALLEWLRPRQGAVINAEIPPIATARGTTAWLRGRGAELTDVATTDAGGAATTWLDRDTKGYVLRVTARSGYCQLFADLALPAGDGRLAIEMTAFGHLVGRLPPGAPSRERVSVRVRGNGLNLLVPAQPDGSFRSHPLPLGDYEVLLQLRPRRQMFEVPSSLQRVRIDAPGDYPVRFGERDLLPATLRGRVDADGPLPAGLRVWLVRATGVENATHDLGPVAADGAFVGTGITPGPWRLAFAMADEDHTVMPGIQHEQVTLLPGEEAWCRLTYRPRRLVVNLRFPNGGAFGASTLQVAAGGFQWPRETELPRYVASPLVLDPAPLLPITFAAGPQNALAPAVVMPTDRAEHELTVTLPDEWR